MSFKFQVDNFTAQLVELIEMAKDEAALEFQSYQLNWEQRERELQGEIAGLESNVGVLANRLQEAELKYEALRAKLSDLV